MQPKPQRVEKKHSSKGTVNHFSICDIHQSAVIIHSYLLPLIRSSFPQISRDENYHVLFPGSWETASQNRRYGIRGQNETTADNPLVPSRQRSPKNAVPHQRQQKVRTASYSLSTKHLHLPYIYIYIYIFPIQIVSDNHKSSNTSHHFFPIRLGQWLGELLLTSEHFQVDFPIFPRERRNQERNAKKWIRRFYENIVILDAFWIYQTAPAFANLSNQFTADELKRANSHV